MQIIITDDTERDTSKWIGNTPEFTEDQIRFMTSLGVPVNFEKNLSGHDYVSIEMYLTEYLKKIESDKKYYSDEKKKKSRYILSLL